MSPATLHAFAAANDAAAATPGKLKKQAALGGYFASIAQDDDLRRAVRFAGGQAFPATDERVLNVGGAIVSDVLLDVLQMDDGAYHALVVSAGEIGGPLVNIDLISTSPSCLRTCRTAGSGGSILSARHRNVRA